MALQNTSPTERFADRVDDYVKYRPHYSPNVIKALQEHCELSPRHLVVDVGCGTGLLAKIFVENGNRVIGVEPNENMRKAGEAYLLGHERFRMVDGTAEKTGLLPESADFVVAGQAFHWFQPAATRREFARIVKSNGWVVLIWHEREMEATPFLRDYEALLQRYATDYGTVAHNKVANYGALEQFYAPDRMGFVEQATLQTFNYEGLRGRLLSSSYAPRHGPAADAMLAALLELFHQYAKDGLVSMEYRTKIYIGHLTP